MLIFGLKNQMNVVYKTNNKNSLLIVNSSY